MDANLIDARVEEILSTHGKGANKLVPILLAAQDAFGYLPGNVIQHVGEFLAISLGQIYSVASFYKRFQLTPVGKRRVTVCRGTACHIRGAPQIVNEIEQTIGIKEGETSADLEYTLETVACIGCCALAPCLKVNEAVHGAMTPRKAGVLFTDVSGNKNA
ncbi:MAG: NAD(P)H-dependent oxidoreductase subunit E [Dehalococcoidales bacterium]|nr:NAD(P)H-dependent oxidoreductase subunit E [Dehalococcoidales bacterium]